MPLYEEIEKKMLDRIASGDLPPGTKLPNEFKLAEEYGVSQGTLRKALDALMSKGLLERKPRHGTVIAQQTSEKAMFAFYRMRDAQGAQIEPETCDEEMRAAHLLRFKDIFETAEVWEIERKRKARAKVFSLETITLPRSLCPEMNKHRPLPNALYPFLEQHYRLTVSRTEEKITAITAPPNMAFKLGVAAGAAVLKVERHSYDIQGNCIEVRESIFATEHYHYAATLER